MAIAAQPTVKTTATDNQVSRPQIQTTKCPNHSYRQPSVPTRPSYRQPSVPTRPQLQTTKCPNQTKLQTTKCPNQTPATNYQVSQPDHSYKLPSVPTRPQLQTTKCSNQTTATDNQVFQPDHSYRQPSVPTRPQLQTTRCPNQTKLQTTKRQNQSYRRPSVRRCTPCVHYRAMLDDEPWIDEGSMVSGSQSVQFARHLI